MNMQTRKADPAVIRALAAEGHSQSTIASLLGVSRERIRQICNREAIATEPGNIDADLSDKMRHCAARGMTLQEAAEELGRSKASLYHKAKREGITFAEPKYRWHQIRDAAAEGLTITECARRMGWLPHNVFSEAKRHGIVFHATKKSPRQSAVKGVSWIEKHQRWRAQIGCGKTYRYLGEFVREEDAIAARKAAEGQK